QPTAQPSSGRRKVHRAPPRFGGIGRARGAPAGMPPRALAWSPDPNSIRRRPTPAPRGCGERLAASGASSTAPEGWKGSRFNYGAERRDGLARLFPAPGRLARDRDPHEAVRPPAHPERLARVGGRFVADVLARPLVDLGEGVLVDVDDDHQAAAP